MNKLLENKTGKREIALLLTGILTWSIFQGDVSMVEVIVWPILVYVGGVSGVHMWDKRNSSRETTSGEQP